MDFSWPNEYLDFKESVIQFAKKELNVDTISRDESQSFSDTLWKKMADFGIQSLCVTEPYGGPSEKVKLTRAILAMEALGYACEDTGLLLALSAQMWTVQTPVLHFANEFQKKKYLIPMAKGEKIGAHALTEPSAGSDVYNMKTTAEKVDGGYILNGKKHLITLAPICDFALVFASTNPKLKSWGLSVFFVDKEFDGFQRSEKKTKMGMRTVPFGELEFNNCFVPEENLMGKEGLGFSILNHSLEYDRCCILASQLGTMQRQLEKAIDYVKKRKQFGQSIGKFQSVSNRIVDMKLRLETSRLLLYKTAWLMENGKSAKLETSLLKLQLSESFLASSIDSMRTYGGLSYLTEMGVEKDLRDAVGGVLYAGTSDIQRNIISRLLGL